MDFGVVVQVNPPVPRIVSLARRAEEHSFACFWTYDSHVLWHEPYVVHSQILSNTSQIKVGTMVTNPATRDSTVTASTFATLNAMFGNRTVCGIGRGDSAVRVTNGKPTTLAQLRESIHIIRELANSRSVDIGGSQIRLPWSNGSQLDVWIGAYGPMALRLTGEVGDGFILQCGDLDIARWMIGTVRSAAADAERDPDDITFCVAAPMYVTDGTAQGRAHAIEQCRWFGGMVGNHVADIVQKYGTDSEIPRALTDYIRERKGYDYNEHGKARNSHVDFVPDEIVERFCVIGTADEHREKLEKMKAIGVDHFAGYLDHDNKDETLRVYGETIIPALRDDVTAKA
jgi:probable F420-dependent oxidoreductase